MAWKPGQSGNPGGRPKHGNGLAEVIRKKLDPEIVFEKLLKIAETSPSEQTQLRALELLMERGWKKPAQVVEVGPADPYEDLSDEELAALEAQEQAVLAGGGALALGAAGADADEPADVVQEPDVGVVSYDTTDGKPVSPASGSDFEARAPLVEAAVGECRTTGERVGAGGSVRIRRYRDPEDE